MSIPFLDMLITRFDSSLSSKWYTKPTDTGLTMNFHALASTKYKRSVVTGLVHRIHRACSTWANFYDSLEKAKTILRNNQYSQQFYEPIISRTLSNIITNSGNREEDTDKEREKEDQTEEKMVFVQYRGRVFEKFEESLKRLKVPCKVIFTLKKLKMELPNLKFPVEKSYKSRLVYKIPCSRCSSGYVGQTSRHVITRLKEHKRSGPFKECGVNLSMDNVSVLCVTSRSSFHLMALEALMINEHKPPALNTKDEYRI